MSYNYYIKHSEYAFKSLFVMQPFGLISKSVIVLFRDNDTFAIFEGPVNFKDIIFHVISKNTKVITAIQKCVKVVFIVFS